MRRGAVAALVAGSLVAAVVGWFVAKGSADGAEGTARGAVPLYACPLEGAETVGRLEAGDQVWLVGVTADRWAVVRRPDSPGQQAWVPLAMVDTAATARDLPEVTCEAAVPTAATAPATTPTTAPIVTTTTVGAFEASTTTSTLPATTVPSDRTPPTVTLSSPRPYLYVTTNVAPCSDEDELEVAIAVADPTLPVSIRSIVATWNAPSGPQTATLTPSGGNRFRLVVPANGPASGELPLTLTATANDGAGNVGTGTLVVALRDPNSFGCAA